MRRRLWLALLGAMACGAACDDDVFGGGGRSQSALTRSSPCDKWSALAGDVGCALPSRCAIEQRCAEAARAFIDCAAGDLSQCLCESGDDELNCEGAYKPGEGPARCTAEHHRLDACLGAGAVGL